MNEMQGAADLARLLGDPIRLTLLQALVRKEATVSELLAATGASQSNLSNHLRLLRERDVIAGQRQGRQILYRIPSPAIAELVDALLRAAGTEESGSPPAGPLAEARTCYDHLAGRLGVALLEGLAAMQAVVLPKNSWTEVEMGPHATSIFERLGINIAAAGRDGTRRRFAYACPDWSEHGHFHLGGLIGASLCNQCLRAGWIEPDAPRRSVKLTEVGKSSLEWLVTEAL